MNLPALQTIETERGAIAYRRAGDGPPLVCLHGIGSGSASWAAQLDGLADRFDVIAWDTPGYGGSAPLGAEAPAASDYAAALKALLDALDIGRIHLLGHSLGGLVAAAFAAANPDRLLSVTLADAAAGYLNASDDVRVGRLKSRIDAMYKDGPAAVAERRAREVLSEGAPDEIYEKIRSVQSQVRPDGYAQAARMLHGSDIFVDAAAIHAPALIMCGSADKVTSEAISREIAATIKGARYLTLEGLGHASYVEGPDVFNTALADFIGSLA